MQSFTPREIVSELDKYIVGQKNAKRSVAIALRNRWRRQQVADPEHTLVISGNGDVIEPDEGVTAIGSGGPYAHAAAKALTGFSDLDAKAIVEQSMKIAASICIYTNEQIIVEEL